MTLDNRCADCERGPCAQHLAPAELTRRSRPVAEACAAVDPERLKIRPCEVLQCVMCGDSNASIAERLGISVSTVKYHLRRIVAQAARRPANDI
ncbi:helix-turn-helix transcriptional regulator [Caulobacter sp. KR2-114]|uniref:helix-turn-helix transcriptional regulator n=1 Tax=Caulobacter sp. KR2-114 TaxID=3400912 RepID=UPI003C032ABC